MKEMKNISIENLEALETAGMLVEHHTAWYRGYVSRKGRGYVVPYSGRFGAGYAWHHPCKCSTQYSYITYYIYA